MTPPPQRERVLRFLDDLRAAEAAAAEVLVAWMAVCALDGLRGGLRAIAEREAVHADLLSERLRELGAPAVAVLAEPMQRAALARFGSAAVSDEEKLALLLARYPDDDAASRPIVEMLEHLDHDLETRELLQLIAEGERVTLAWFRAYHNNAEPRLRLGSE